MTVSSQISGTRAQASDVYTDLNSLQDIRALGKDDKNAALMKVAQQFESMFMNMMMSSMRQANAVFTEDSMFSSPEMDFYQGMYDNQMALELTGTSNGGASGAGKSVGGTGLADVIYRQLKQNYGDVDERDIAIDQSTLWDRRVSSQPLNQAIEQVDEVLQQQALSESLAEAESVTAESPVSSPQSPASSPEIASSDSAESTALAATGSGSKGQQFATPEAFVAALYPHAEVVGAELGVDPRAIVAQAALETGWGKHMIADDAGRNSFNFFGIKADSRWQGDSVEVMTHEYRQGVRVNETASFRSYASLEDGLRDYADFLSGNSRYQDAIGQGLGADDYGHALQQAGYATDPEYGNKIERIARSAAIHGAAIHGAAVETDSKSVELPQAGQAQPQTDVKED